LYAGLLRLASRDDTVLAPLVEQVLAGDELGSGCRRLRLCRLSDPYERAVDERL
jgi:hypothetical protein